MTDHVGRPIRPGLPQVKGRIELRRTRTPYLGSVRFFKHVIIGFVLLMMIVPWTLVAFLAGAEKASLAEAAYLEDRLQSAQEEIRSKTAGYEELLEQAALDLDETRSLVDWISLESDLLQFHSAYGYLYPDLRVDGPAGYADSAGTVYLTFDDGPGGSTRSILEVLKRYGIKATFFVVGYAVNGREDILRQVAEEGHNIGVHSNSHVYRDIYSSLEAFFYDFYGCSTKIEEITGIKPNIFRFPGGSVNSYTETWGNTIISEMLNRGYRYYDWNVGSGDASLEADAATIYEAVIRQIRANDYSVVLMHDGGGKRSQTLQALPLIIDRLLQDGYRFDVLTNEVRPTVFEAAGYSRG